jgi:hypothetical protein
MLTRRVDALDSILACRPVLVRHLDRDVLRHALRGARVPEPGSYFRVRLGHLDAIAEAGADARQDVSPDVLTDAELAHAREVIRTRWTRQDARELRRLPHSERMVVAALAAFLDAAPEPPRCVVCGHAEFRVKRTPDGWLCAFEPACRYRTRVAAGVPVWRALRDLEAEKAAA